MKAFFQYCAYCGERQPITELWQDQYSGFLLCRDHLACAERVNQSDQSFIDALKARLARIEKEREAVIILLGKEMKKRGIADPVEEKHKVEMERIEADDLL